MVGADYIRVLLLRIFKYVSTYTQQSVYLNLLLKEGGHISSPSYIKTTNTPKTLPALIVSPTPRIGWEGYKILYRPSTSRPKVVSSFGRKGRVPLGSDPSFGLEREETANLKGWHALNLLSSAEGSISLRLRDVTNLALY